MGMMETNLEAIQRLKRCSAKDVDLGEFGKTISELARELVETRKGVSMKGVSGAPDWLGFESDLWSLSEELREFYRKNRTLRGRNPLSDRLAELAGDVRLGKGRQNLVLILGEYGRGEYGAELGRLLDDSDVYGHAIKSLNRGKVGGYRERIEAILEAEKHGWIKAAARKYLKTTACSEGEGLVDA